MEVVVHEFIGFKNSDVRCQFPFFSFAHNKNHFFKKNDYDANKSIK